MLRSDHPGFFQEYDGRTIYVPPGHTSLYAYLLSELGPEQLLASIIQGQRCHVTAQLRKDAEGWHLTCVGPPDHLSHIEARVRGTMPLGQAGAEDMVN